MIIIAKFPKFENLFNYRHYTLLFRMKNLIKPIKFLLLFISFNTLYSC